MKVYVFIAIAWVLIGILGYELWSIPEHNVAPPVNPALLEFVEDCEEQDLIVTWIDEDTVSCVPRR